MSQWGAAAVGIGPGNLQERRAREAACSGSCETQVSPGVWSTQGWGTQEAWSEESDRDGTAGWVRTGNPGRRWEDGEATTKGR